MKRKIAGIFVMTLLIAATVLPVAMSMNVEKTKMVNVNKNQGRFHSVENEDCKIGLLNAHYPNPSRSINYLTGDEQFDNWEKGGEDQFDSTTATVKLVIIPLGIFNIQTVSVEGPTTVKRLEPTCNGHCKIDTEIISMNLIGDFMNETIWINESSTKSSIGIIQQREAGVDFPAYSFFDVYVEIQTELLPSIILHNEVPINMTAVINDIPPYMHTYISLKGWIPLYTRSGILFGWIMHASHKLPPHTEVVDNNVTVGLYSSSVVDENGWQYCSYYDEINGDLKYAVWNEKSWDIEIVDSYGDVGLYTSLALDSYGDPHITYYDNTNHDLKMACWYSPEEAWSIQTIDSVGDVGWSTSLALDTNDIPHISYYDFTNYKLKYATVSLKGWDLTSLLDGGLYNSLDLTSDSRPYIAYTGAYGGVMFTWYCEEHGWDSMEVDSSGEGWDVSLACDYLDGAHISYYSDGYLKYAVSSGGPFTIEPVDSVTYGGWGSSIATYMGDPCISYYNYENKDLEYAKKFMEEWLIVTVDSEGDVGQHSSLCLKDGYAHITYYDATNGNLKKAVEEVPPPTVEITRPKNKLYINNKDVISIPWTLIIGPITVEVEAIENESGIDRVEFYIDNELKSTDYEAPYEWLWDETAFRSHIIKVEAYDKAGNGAMDVKEILIFNL